MGKLVIWNPDTLVISGEIAIANLAKTGLRLNYSQNPALTVGQKIYMPVGYLSQDRSQVPSQNGVVVVDTTNDTASFVEDTRCGFARDGVLASDGNIYLASETYASAVHHLDSANGAAPCLLRFDPTTDQYDAQFNIDMQTLAGNAPAGTLLKGPAGTFYTRTGDTSILGTLVPPIAIVLSTGPAWSWQQITLEDTPTLQLDTNLPVNTGRVFVIDVSSDESVLPIYRGRDATNFWTISGTDIQTPGVEIEGLVFGVLKLR